jgi:chemotaxis protein MotB
MISKRHLKVEETSDNNDRWLVSYADFITLLFAFFVVMYALSSVNDGKYRVLSNSLVSAFKSTSANPISFQSADLQSIIEQTSQHVEKNTVSPAILNDKKEARINRQKKMKTMAKDILLALEPLVQDGKVRVTQNALGITVEINASVLFSPGKAQLAESSSLSLSAVAQVVKDHDHDIHVEGHTDNIPIHTHTFPSNWELSTARASSVIRLFIANGVAAHRMTAIGYAENKPVETNATLEGRKRNRRVAVMILSNEPESITEIPVSLGSTDHIETIE